MRLWNTYSFNANDSAVRFEVTLLTAGVVNASQLSTAQDNSVLDLHQEACCTLRGCVIS